MQIKSWNLQEFKNKFLEMQSWKIVRFGVIVQGIITLLFVTWTTIEIFSPHIAPVNYGAGLALIFFYFIQLAIAIIILFFIYFEKTRKVGAILSLIFGMVQLVNMIGVVYLAAGFNYFWKENKPKL